MSWTSRSLRSFFDSTDASSKSDFNYGSALGPGHIRLFRIRPALSNGLLSVSLETYSITEQIDQYKAISYAWGSTERTSEIICNGRPMFLTKSLHDILLQFREDKYYQPLWADAMCINQNDNKEKSQQVREMTGIYRDAESTIVWLGAKYTYAEHGLEILQRINDLPGEFRLENEGANHCEDRELLSRVGLPTVESPRWRYVGHIITRPWFSRMWVLREALAAKRVIMRLGPTTLNFENVFQASDRMANSPLLIQALTVEEHVYLVRYVGCIRAFLGRRHNINEFPLATLLSRSSQLRCRDPKDRYFATLDCSSVQQSSIVDYDLPLPEIAYRFACLNVDSCVGENQETCDEARNKARNKALFEALSCVDTRKTIAGVPSWCQAYHDDLSPITLSFFGIAPPQNSDNDWQDFLVDEDRRLSLRGFVADEITECQRAPEYCGFPYGGSTSNVLERDELLAKAFEMICKFCSSCEKLADRVLARDGFPDPFSRFLRCLRLEECHGRAREESFKFRKEMYLEWRLLCFARFLIHSQGLGKDNPRGRADAFLKKTLFEAKKTILTRNPSEKHPLEQLLEENDSEDPVRALSFILHMMEVRSSRMIHCMASTWSGQAFCGTAKRRIGFAPGHSETGDTICLFKGCGIPFVLRPLEASGETEYQLIGTCQIEGLMFGEIDHASMEEQVLKIR